jgi:osmoprotectant transport system substrate-binding protein
LRTSTVVAALCALLLSACGGGDEPRARTVATPEPAVPGRGPVVLATKNFTEQFILGEIYRQGLEAAGFEVELKQDVGSSEIVDKALEIGVIDMYLEYMGVIAGELAGTRDRDRPRSPDETYARAKAFEESRGFTILKRAPGFDALANGVLASTARRHKLKTTADLKRLGRFRYGGPPENRRRFQGALGMQRVYDLEFDYVPIPIPERYQALDDGDVDVVAVFTTERQLLNRRKYVTLSDPEGIFGFQNIVPVIEQEVLRRQGPEFERRVNKITENITNRALRKMNGAVDLDGRKPAEVAREFLLEEGLL